MSKAIAERLADSKSTKRQIEENRERYRPVAVRGSLLYFTVAELCRVDVMYQYSLDYFQVCMYSACGIAVGKIRATSWPFLDVTWLEDTARSIGMLRIQRMYTRWACRTSV